MKNLRMEDKYVGTLRLPPLTRVCHRSKSSSLHYYLYRFRQAPPGCEMCLLCLLLHRPQLSETTENKKGNSNAPSEILNHSSPYGNFKQCLQNSCLVIYRNWGYWYRITLIQYQHFFNKNPCLSSKQPLRTSQEETKIITPTYTRVLAHGCELKILKE